MSAKSAYRKSLSILTSVMVTFAVLLLWNTPSAYAGDAPATQYVARHWENGQVVSETKTQNDMVWMTDGHLEWHDGWWYTRDLDELVISDRVSVDNGATANLILMDGKTIEFENGIRVPKGSTLNIYGQAQGTGKLIVLQSEADTAAIGGNAGESCGTINIFGGTIQVRGGSEYSNGGAGIGGGGSASNEGAINIYGGTIESRGGANAAGIGGGARGGHGGAISIYGGVVTAYGDSGAAGIGGGEGGSGSGTYIYGGMVHAKGGSLYSDGGAGIGSGNKNGNNSIAAGDVVIYGGTVFAEGGADAAGIGGGNEVSGGRVIINEVYSNIKVKAWGGMLGAGIGGGQYGNGGNIEIRIGDDPDKSKVEAAGGEDGAGIGGGSCGSGGNIEIYSGYVLADGGDYGAAIGSGDADGDGIDGGNIKIYGGTIHVMGGTDAAGIGGGEGAGAGTIDIRNATVRASGGSRTSEGGAAIGSGDKDGRTFNNGTITISDSDIIANGGAEAAGIGGGHNCNGGTITITNSTVIAYNGDGSDGGAGIGGGGGEDERTPKADGTAGAGTIKIIDCPMVKASGGNGAAGIGGGYYADDNNDGNVTIENSNVVAKGGKYAAGIGTGKVGVSLFGENSISEYKVNVSINGGTIKATGGDEGGAGIGGGSYGYSGAIRIYGGIVEATGGGNGGAGIGSGDDVDRPGTTVDIVIEGGTITARAGKMPAKEEGNYNDWNHPGAAIGTGGCGTFSGSRDMSYFRGSIYLNGGDITAYGAECESGYGSADNKCTAIGATVEKSLVGGKVYFNGAHVEMYPGHGSENTSSQAVKASGIELKGNDTLHQQVDYKVDGSDSLEVALKDARVSTLTSTGNHYVEVKPCEHSNASWTITDTTHSRVCEYCEYSVSDEAHTYGNPEWTWGENHATAVAKFTCSVCKHVETLNASVTTEEFEATGEDPAKTVYTAKVTLAGQEHTDVVEMPHGLPNATITTEPEAKTLTYKGREQQLVTAGAATGGQILYALGNESGATEEFTETIPVGTDADDYKVWYMVKGDSGHNDIPAKRVDAAIEKADFSAIEFTLTPDEATYTGSAIKPEVKGVFNSGTAEDPDRIAVDASEYSFSYDDNVNAGTATVSITSSEKNFTGGTTNLEFEIKKAPNNVTVSMVGWTKGEEASTPDVTADFGADTASLEYKVKDADDSTYTGTVPSEIGEYTVKATIAGSSNYEGGEATCDFEIIQKKYTVTFDPNEGTGTKEAESIAENGSYILPSADTFGAPEGKCRLKAWEVKIGSAEPVEKAPGASITVTADTMVKALWGDHVWSPVEYKWSDDNSQVTATRVCAHNADHTETETVSATSEITKQPTCTEKGETTYTSSAFQNTAFEVQTKTEEDVAIDPDAHAWGAVAYEWADDNSTVTATRVCAHNADHTETETVGATSEITKQPTCAEKGETTYTSAAFQNTAFDAQTKTEEMAIDSNAHSWGDISYIWADDNSKVTATRVCAHNADHTETETVSTTSEITKQPTCTEKGETTYTSSAFQNTAFEVQTKTEEMAIDPNAHSWGDISYTWAGDNSTVTATRVCAHNADHTETETVGATSEITKQPTCAKKGETTYTSSAFQNTAFEVQTKTEEMAIDSNAHSWGDISYAWADDNSTVTATRTCAHDADHVETETVGATSEITKQPTCTEKGETTYTSSAFQNTAFEVQTKTEEDVAIDPDAHSWGAVAYEWADDNNSVTATRVCAHNADHTETETVGTTSEITKQPTCTEKGETTYTSSAFQNTAFEVQTKTVVNIEALDHAWGEITYKWADDNSTVTATRVCKNDSSHVETETVDTTSEITKQPTCTEKGETTYTSAAFNNKAFIVQTKTVVNIEALDHAWGEITYKWADDNSTVTATRVCEHDATHVETETADVTSETIKQPTCSAAGETTYTAIFENPAFAEQSKTEEDVAIDPDAHAWGAVAYEWADDNSEATATRVCAHDATHTETETAETKAAVTKEPTETEEGERTYTATFTNPAFAKQTKTESISKKDHVHDWNEPVYVWSADNSSVTATRTCRKDESHVETETVKTTAAVTREATETEEGKRTYTAAFTNPAFAEQTKTESIPKKEPVGPGPVDPDPVKPDPAKPDPTDPEPQPQPQPAPSGSVSYRNTEGDGTQWTKGSAVTADFTFKRSENDSETFSHFIGIQVDGKDVAASNYTAESGSVIVKLKPAYLETLSVGEHTLTALFDDGNKASAKFTVVERKASDNSTTGAPKTGDTSNMLLWLAILCASILVLFNVITIRRRNGFGRRG